MLKSKYLIFCLLLISSHLSLAQVSIKGKVIDSENKNVDAASITLLTTKDSVLYQFALSDENGNYAINSIEQGKYILLVVGFGYEKHSESIEITTSHIEKNITLFYSSQILPNITVSGERDPMKISKDTVIYNTSAFKTRPGDVVEDLLKKLPGIEVQSDGSVKAYGEDVKKVMVDGKEFFGSDTRLATKNLEAEAVDKVQVFDKKSDDAEFTGIEDGNDERTINFKLKETHKNGYFGNASASAGSNSRFNGKVSYNAFKPSTRASFIGTGNNINERTFSIQEYIDLMGGIAAFMSGGQARIEIDGSEGMALGLNDDNRGIQKALGTGVNINHTFSKNTSLQASYFSNFIGIKLSQKDISEILSNKLSYVNRRNSTNDTKGTGHVVNLILKSRIDTIHNLILKLNGGLSSSDNNGFIGQENTIGLAIANEGPSQSQMKGSSFRYQMQATYQRKLSKRGRTLSTTALMANNNLTQNGSISRSTKYYLPNAYADSLSQDQKYSNEAKRYSFNLIYTEPLRNKVFLEAKGNVSNSINNIYADYYDLHSGNERIYNTALSNNIDRKYNYTNTALGINISKDKYFLNGGLAYQNSALSGTSLNGSNIKPFRFNAMLPYATLEYSISMSHNINLRYITALREPTIQQLQEIIDNRDPQNIYIGNAALKPEYAHILDTRYMRYDQFSFSSIFASLSIAYINDKITDALQTDENLRRIRTPVNVKNERTVNSSIEYNTPIRPLKIAIKTRWKMNYGKSLTSVDKVKDAMQRMGNTISLSVENRKKDVIDLLIGYKHIYNHIIYDKAKQWNQNYNATSVYGDLNINMNERWTLNTEVDKYGYKRSFTTDEDSYTLLNMKINYIAFKNQNVKFTLSGFDLLNQNTGITQNNQYNSYNYSKYNTLGRYVMVGIQYSLRGFKKSNNVIEISNTRD
jgi:hypothetical protein